MIYDIEDLSLLEGLDPVIMSKEKLDLDIDDADLVFEAFAGKMPYADKIEKNMEFLVNKIQSSDDIVFKNDVGSYNYLPEVKEMAALFKKAFGFKEFVLNFYDVHPLALTVAKPNAFTFPSAHIYFSMENMKKLLTSGKMGVDAVYSTAFVNVAVDVNLIRSLRLTARETIAIILHEIGHDLEVSYTGFVSQAALILTTAKGVVTGKVIDRIFAGLGVGVLTYGPWGTAFTEVAKVVNDFLMSMPVFNKVARFASRMYKEFDAAKDFQRLFDFKRAIKAAAGIYTNPTRLMHAIFDIDWLARYSSEKFADSFAAKWGYGPDMASGLNKTSDHKELIIEKIIHKIPILNNIYFDLFQGVLTLLRLPFDPHPKVITRVRTQLDNLKKDLNDPSLDPRLKKELASNIKEMEEVLQRMLEIKPDQNDGRVFQVIINNIFNMFMGISDIRDLIAPNIRA